MKFIQELYELQEDQKITECVTVLESAADILSYSSMGMARGADPLSLKVVSGLANKEETGIETLSAIYAGIEAIILKGAGQPDKAKQTLLNMVDQAEFKTNNTFTSQLAALGHKQEKLQVTWRDLLTKIQGAHTTLKSNPKDADAKATFMELSKEAEKKLKDMHLKLARTVKTLNDDLKTAKPDVASEVKLP